MTRNDWSDIWHQIKNGVLKNEKQFISYYKKWYKQHFKNKIKCGEILWWENIELTLKELSTMFIHIDIDFKLRKLHENN